MAGDFNRLRLWWTVAESCECNRLFKICILDSGGYPLQAVR